MDKDMPADWAHDKTMALIDADHGEGWARKVVASGAIESFARYIEAHEQPPVDPDLVTAREILVTAREIVAKVFDHVQYNGLAGEARRGASDKSPDLQFALAKLKEARGK